MMNAEAITSQRKKLLASSKPPLLKDIEAVRYETIHASSTLPIRDDRSLIFDIPAQKGFYIDLSLLKIHIRYRVLRGNGSVIAGSDMVAPQSAVLYSMFRDLQVNFNNRTVFWGKFLYGYYANLLLLFKIPGNERKMLYSSIYKYDDNSDLVPSRTRVEVEPTETGGQKTSKFVLTHYDGDDIVDDWSTRRAMHTASLEHEVMGNVLFDLAFQDRLIRDDVNIRLTFTPQNPEFCLLAGKLHPSFAVEIRKAVVQVPRVSVKPSAGLPRGDIEYYFVEHRFMTVPVAQNTSNFNRTISTGPLPRRLILSQINEAAFEGDYTKSCYKFPHYNLDNIQVSAGGTRIPVDPLTMDWGSRDVLQAYMSFFNNMKNSLGFTGLTLTRDEFEGDRVFLAFDCTKDMEAGSPHWVEGNHGNLAVNMHWKTPLPENITLVICLEFEMVCRLDKFGQATIDYAPVY